MPPVQRATSAGVTPLVTPVERARGPLARSAVFGGVIVVALAFGAYVATAARDLVFGDSPELVAVAATLGVAHAPGYPVWTLLGHLFSLLPVGPLPFRVGLLSAVCGAACVGVVYATAHRLTRSIAASAIGALVLAFHPLFWQWSIVAEVFALNALLAALVVYCALRWAERPAAARWLYAAAFAGGIGVANQQTIVLVAPAVLYLLWRHRRAVEAEPIMLTRTAAAFVAGLVPYLYLWWAGSQHPYWSFGDISSPGDLLDAVLRRAYGSGQLIVTPSLQGGTVGDRLSALARSFTLLEGALLALGLIQLFRRAREVFWSFAVALGISGPAFVLYANADASISLAVFVLGRFFVLVHVLAAPVCASGIRFVAELAARPWRARLELATAAMAGLAILATTVPLYANVDRSADHDARHFAEDLLASTPQGATYLVSGDAAAYPVQYLHSIEGARSDLSVIQPPLLPAAWYARELRRLYPELNLPAGGGAVTLQGLLDANASRRFVQAGHDLDRSITPAYRLDLRGLDADVVAGTTPPPDVGALLRESDRLFADYRPPRFDPARNDAFVRIVLVDYIDLALRMGATLEALDRFAEARTWYERGLAIEPDVRELRQALDRIKGK